jgi:hypothetical protein
MNMQKNMAMTALLALLYLSVTAIAGVRDVEYAENEDFFQAEDGAYLWQTEQAEVLERGDLAHRPEPFAYRPGNSIRYIDYENGNDEYPGTPDQPWKHHPWDVDAPEFLREREPADTYVFKRGVVYRGVIHIHPDRARASSARLTSDPSWGEGDAILAGSKRVPGPWRRPRPGEAPAGMRGVENVWVADRPPDQRVFGLWEIRGDSIIPWVLARTPNWDLDPAAPDIRRDWYAYESTSRPRKGPRKKLFNVPGHPLGVEPDNPLLGVDSGRLTGFVPGALRGAILRGECSGMMHYPEVAEVLDYDPDTRVLKSNYPRYRDDPTRGSRYYLEGRPAFLDRPGEYLAVSNRLFICMNEGEDPNERAFEAGVRTHGIVIEETGGIEISGLAFRFFVNDAPLGRPFDNAANVDELLSRTGGVAKPYRFSHSAAILTRGTVVGLTVRYCRFEHLVSAMRSMFPDKGDGLDRVTLTDNRVFRSSYAAVVLGKKSIRSNRIKLLRNRFTECGLVYPEPTVKINGFALCQAAGNFAERCGGQGLDLFMGKGGQLNRDRGDAPLLRNLVHHNRVEDCMKLANDFGQIEVWQGGPHYIYANVSVNPGGFWNAVHTATPPEERSFRSSRFAFAYYFDGAQQTFFFNNIARGLNNDLFSPLCNASALNETLTLQGIAFNNTFHRFGAGMVRFLPEFGRRAYLGNIFDDMSDCFIRYDHWNPRRKQSREAFHYDSVIFARNVFSGPDPNYFGSLRFLHPAFPTLETFREELRQWNPPVASVGIRTTRSPIPNADRGDVRPAPGSAAAGRGARCFLPWGLKGEVGAWHFHRFPEGGNPVIAGEEFYMRPELIHRTMYGMVPRWNLDAVGFDADDFIESPTEDWIPGALVFDGVGQYCRLANSSLRQQRTYELPGNSWSPAETMVVSGENRITLDMQTNNFLIEAHFQIGRDAGACTLVEKTDEDAGYALTLDARRRPALTIRFGGRSYSGTSRTALRKETWHHLVAELDRRDVRRPIRIYIDGKEVKVRGRGEDAVLNASLANGGDLLVGRGIEGGHFAGAFDFLRIARGALREAHTTIDELYAWEFDGPHLRDFTGREMRGGPRDAGALQSTEQNSRSTKKSKINH